MGERDEPPDCTGCPGLARKHLTHENAELFREFIMLSRIVEYKIDGELRREVRDLRFPAPGSLYSQPASIASAWQILVEVMSV